MFWTEFGDISQICRASMDGTSKRSIATRELEVANGITIDFTCNTCIVLTLWYFRIDLMLWTCHFEHLKKLKFCSRSVVLDGSVS